MLAVLALPSQPAQASAAQAALPSAANLALTSPFNPSGRGETVMLSARITPVAPSTATPQGTVTFATTEPLCVGAPVQGGVAVCWAAFESGAHLVTATYSGDDRYVGTVATMIQNVGRATAWVVVTSSTWDATIHEPLTLTATVTPHLAWTGTPSGTVTFSDGSNVLCPGVPLVEGDARCTVILGAGLHGIRAAYSGDDGFSPLTSPVFNQMVEGDPATVTLTESAPSSESGHPVTFRAVVAASAPVVGTPTGTVTFSDNGSGTPLCASVALVAGQAACTAVLRAASHVILASYEGSARFNPATSAGVDHSVAQAVSSTALASSSNPSGSAGLVTFTASVSIAAPGLGQVEGELTIRDGATALCQVIITGSSSCNATLTPGAHQIVASYLGNNDVAGSSATLVQTVVLSGTFVPTYQPERLLDTRVGIGGAAAPIGPGATRELVVRGSPTLVPDSAISVVLNVTAVSPSAAGYLTVYPTGAPRPGTSSLNFVANETIPNAAMTAVGANDRISIFNASGTVQVLVDVVGYYLAGGGTAFTAMTPTRIMDTRVGRGGPATRIGPGATRDLVVTGGSTGVPIARAVVLNVTVTNPSAASYLSVFPYQLGRPNVSNLNFAAGQTIANLVVVDAVSLGRINIFNAAGQVDVIVDIVGYFGPQQASTFVAATPKRILDTRTGVGGAALAVGPGGTRQLVARGGATGIPETATAVVMTVTAVAPTATSYLTVHPSGGPRPDASNLNFVRGQTIPNLVVVAIGSDGKVSLFNGAGTVHLVGDVVGYMI